MPGKYQRAARATLVVGVAATAVGWGGTLYAACDDDLARYDSYDGVPAEAMVLRGENSSGNTILGTLKSQGGVEIFLTERPSGSELTSGDMAPLKVIKCVSNETDAYAPGSSTVEMTDGTLPSGDINSWGDAQFVDTSA